MNNNKAVYFLPRGQNRVAFRFNAVISPEIHKSVKPIDKNSMKSAENPGDVNRQYSVLGTCDESVLYSSQKRGKA